MLIEVGKTTDIPEGEARKFVADRIEIAIANLGDGVFLAVDDICSHAESSLSEGEVDVDDETIECPRHGSTFDLQTGRPLTLPATTPVPVFPVKVEGGTVPSAFDGLEVHVDLPLRQGGLRVRTDVVHGHELPVPEVRHGDLDPVYHEPSGFALWDVRRPGHLKQHRSVPPPRAAPRWSLPGWPGPPEG